MNADVKAKWLEALRSGEYVQAQSNLQNEDGFCCLGVLCDLYVQEHPETTWTPNTRYDERFSKFPSNLFGYTDFLPPIVAKWAGLANDNFMRTETHYIPELQRQDAYDPRDRENTRLSEYNDEGEPFTTIADIIERDL